MEAIRYSAPGRAGLVGNPSDMYGGTVISCAIPLRARCTLEPADHLTFQSPNRTVKPETLELQGDEFDLCRAALAELGYSLTRAPFTLRIESDIPVQAGLAGSSALLTTIVACLLHYQEGELPLPHQLAERVRRIEAHRLGVSCGYQDFYMAVFGGLHALEFRDKERLGHDTDEPLAMVEPLATYLRGEPLPLWLATTGGQRFSGAVHRSLRARWEEGERAVVEGMARIGWLARDAKRALLERNWQRLAQRMPTTPAPGSLDGYAWMRGAWITNVLGEPVTFTDDYYAIQWLREHAPGNAVIVEASIGPYRGNGARISSATGLPAVLGWDRHQRQQRQTPEIDRRLLDVRELYSTTDLERKRWLLRRYRVRYVIVGDVERRWRINPPFAGAQAKAEPYTSEAGLAAFEQLEGTLLRRVFESGSTIIYEVLPFPSLPPTSGADGP